MYSVPQGTEIEVFRKVLAPLQCRSLYTSHNLHCCSQVKNLVLSGSSRSACCIPVVAHM